MERARALELARIYAIFKSTKIYRNFNLAPDIHTITDIDDGPTEEEKNL